MAPSDTTTQRALQRVINTPLDSEDDVERVNRRYEAHFALPRDKYNATGFGGKVHGVCTLIRQDVQSPDGDRDGKRESRTKRPDWDLEGRVLLTEIPCQALVVMNVYAVNGTDYDYRSPTTGKVIGTRHTFKRQFHTHIASTIQSYESHGWGVLLIGDMNISRSPQDSLPQLRIGEAHVANRADFEKKLIEERGMLDTFRLVRGGERKYTYRPRGKTWGEGGDRVDLGLVTPGLKGRVSGADILDTESERGTSDHVPLFVEIGGRGKEGQDDEGRVGEKL